MALKQKVLRLENEDPAGNLAYKKILMQYPSVLGI